MNKYLRWFSIVTWLGILAMLWFAVPALFVPEYVINTLGLDPDRSTVWLRNVGMLLLLLAIFNATAARAPHQHPVFAWLIVVNRMIAAVFWLQITLVDALNATSQPQAFIPLFVGDLAFGTVMASLLYIGLRREAG